MRVLSQRATGAEMPSIRTSPSAAKVATEDFQMAAAVECIGRETWILCQVP